MHYNMILRESFTPHTPSKFKIIIIISIRGIIITPYKTYNGMHALRVSDSVVRTV
jgi:Mn2+/Fe2+ NRAMP family transporter